MGVSSANKFSFRSIELQWVMCVYLFHELAKKMAIDVGNPSPIHQGNHPTIDIDANNVAFRYFVNQGKDAVDGIMQMCRSCSENDMNVCVVADGRMRFDTKRASATRTVNREKNRLKILELKARLSACIQNNEDAAAQAVSNQLQKAQKTSSKVLDDSFLENLEMKIQLDGGRDEQQRSIELKIAESQADPIIARRSIGHISTVIWSNDSDFIVHNPKCLQIFSCGMPRDGVPNKVILATGSGEIADCVTKILQTRFDALKHAEIFRTPDKPVFDYAHEPDPMCRALLACAIGNDYWEGGQHNFGVSKANEVSIEGRCKSTEERREFILDKITKCATATKGVSCRVSVKELAMAFLYEPANEEGLPRSYIFSSIPPAMPHYLRKYGDGNNVLSMEDSARVEVCKFIGHRQHEFLAEEGHHSCSLCASVMCRKCCVPYGNGGMICMECYQNSFSFDHRDVKSLEEMTEELICEGRQVPAGLSYLETLELFECYRDFTLGDNQIRGNQYPLEHTGELYRENGKFSCPKFECTVGELGRACRTDRMSNADVSNLIHLLSELVRYDVSGVEGKVYRDHLVVPAIMINFADGARMGESASGGLRIIKRAQRHALYEHEPEIRDASLKIGYYGDEMYLDITKRVAASYHKTDSGKFYHCRCIFGGKSLICTECDCKVGAKLDTDDISKSDKHTCVHPPSEIYGLTLELHKGLAENILIELSVRVAEHGMSSFEGRESLKRDILLLASAAGKKLDESASLRKMLESFSVGTDQSKRYPGDPMPDSIRPIRECKFVHPAAKAKRITSGAWREEVDESDDDESDMTNTPAMVDNATAKQNVYPFEEIQALDEFENETLRVSLVIDVMKKIIAKHYRHTKERSSSNKGTPIGWRLLRKRAERVLDKLGLLRTQFEKEEVMLEIEEQIMKAINQSQYQSHPTSHRKRARSGDNEGVQHAQTQQASHVATPICRPCSKDDDNKQKTRWHTKCGMVNCEMKCKGKPGRMTRVPPYHIPRKDKSNLSITHQITAFKKQKNRAEITDRLGLGRLCKKQGLRYCSTHKTEWIDMSFKIPIHRHNGSIHYRKTHWKLLAPKAIGSNSIFSKNSNQQCPKRKNKGIAFDRGAHRILQQVDRTSNSMSNQQSWEMRDVDSGQHDLSQINAAVLEAASLDIHSRAEEMDRLAELKRSPKVKNKKRNNAYLNGRPRFCLDDLTPDVVRSMTGHADISNLLATAIMISGGMIDVMTKTQSKLTWIEEWLFFFQFGYGRTHVRWSDYKSSWNLRVKTARKIIRTKLKLVKKAKDRWPMYASLDEDEALRNEKWNEIFGRGKYRVVMHDNTNAGKLPKPSDPELNMATWSMYYGCNTSKGGVATQPCGWIVTFELYTGAVGDSTYVTKTKILERQEEFQAADKMSDGKVIPFTNIFDKGYRIIMDCHRHGKQFCWQPFFARSDRRYGSNGIHLTAAVASTRSGNEWSVRQVKHSWYIKRGYDCSAHFETDLLADWWLAQGFLVNFMYDSVH